MNGDERAAAAKATAGAISEVASVVEGVHVATTKRVRAALSTLGPSGTAPVDAARAHSALTYSAVRGVAGLLGHAVAAGVRATTADDQPSITDSPRGAAMVAGLGSAFGDHLAGSDDTAALAPHMSIRADGRTVPATPKALAAAFPDATSQLAVLVHGLAVTELTWSEDYRDALAQRDFTTVHVRYNTGDAIADNAARLDQLLADLAAAWPEPPTRVILVGHSMGGLVCRLALRSGDEKQAAWAEVTTDVVTLGAPHGGAPLEKVANAAIGLLRYTDVTRSLADLADRRSRGIKDLRWGHRESVPDRIRHHAVVAHLTEDPTSAKAIILGDGMVRTHSAAGSDSIDVDRRVIPIVDAGHLNLLDHPTVTELLIEVAETDDA